MRNRIVCPGCPGTSEKRRDKENWELDILFRGQTHFRVCPGNNIPKRDNELFGGFDPTAELQKQPSFPMETTNNNRDKHRNKQRRFNV